MKSNNLGSRMEGKTFVFPVRVYYEDTDAGGVVYYANYLKFAERARTEFLRHLKITNSTFQERHGLAFVVRHIGVDYISPARLDDMLDVCLTVTKVGGASLEGVQSIKRDGQLLLTLNIRLGCMKLAGGPGRFPNDIRDILRAVETPIEE